MKTPSFFELKTIVEYLADELVGSQLQEVMSTEDGLVMGFYRFDKSPRMVFLVFDLYKPCPFIGLTTENPWLKFKKTKPLALFLNAHAKNHYFSDIKISNELGRVVQLQIGTIENLVEIEFRLIPKQINLIVGYQKKSISWLPVKELAQNDLSYTQSEEGEEIRSVVYLTNQWKVRRAFFSKKNETSSQTSVSPFDSWIKSRQKDLAKKTKALETIQKQIHQLQNEEWGLVGEYLKTHGLKNLKPEWSVYVDFEKNVSTNMQRCFEKAKAAKLKAVGAQDRLKILKQEIIDCGDLSEQKFNQFTLKLQKKQKATPIRKLEGRLRKMELSDVGLVAYMGKSAADNMFLLKNSKPHDLWLHLKDYPSAHAIIHRQKNQNIADADLVKFSQWLVSEGLSAKNNQIRGKLAVVVVECRHVKPLKGDKMGRVTYHNAREVLIAL